MVVPIWRAFALTVPFAFITGCDDDASVGERARTFTVTIENVSTPNAIGTTRASGTVPVSPGVWAVYDAADPMFTPGQPADVATERLAEDGFPDQKATAVAKAAGVSASGTFEAPGGPDAGPALFAGEKVTFTVTAQPGDRLQVQTMFVQSNDWFYAFGGGGLELFGANDVAVEGDVTKSIVLYDAGTEEDTAPGTGPNQKPAQSAEATNVGPADAVERIETAGSRHPVFQIPTVDDVIKITITSVPAQ